MVHVGYNGYLKIYKNMQLRVIIRVSIVERAFFLLGRLRSMSVRAVPRKIATQPLVPTSVAANMSPPGAGQPYQAPKLTMDDLTPDEQAAAMCGASPDQLVGLNWLNNAHHDQLVKSNALSDVLARRIEAHRIVSGRAIEHNI